MNAREILHKIGVHFPALTIESGVSGKNAVLVAGAVRLFNALKAFAQIPILQDTAQPGLDLLQPALDKDPAVQHVTMTSQKFAALNQYAIQTRTKAAEMRKLLAALVKHEKLGFSIKIEDRTDLGDVADVLAAIDRLFLKTVERVCAEPLKLIAIEDGSIQAFFQKPIKAATQTFIIGFLSLAFCQGVQTARIGGSIADATVADLGARQEAFERVLHAQAERLTAECSQGPAEDRTVCTEEVVANIKAFAALRDRGVTLGLEVLEDKAWQTNMTLLLSIREAIEAVYLALPSDADVAPPVQPSVIKRLKPGEASD